jgi:hypothetical protein
MAEFLTSGTSRTSESFHFQAAHNFWQMMSWRNMAKACCHSALVSHSGYFNEKAAVFYPCFFDTNSSTRR